MTTAQWPVTLHTQDDDTSCKADLERLREVLANLLSNASKHTPAGTAITVTVDCVVDDQGAWAESRISDTGPGVPEALLPHLGRGRPRMGWAWACMWPRALSRPMAVPSPSSQRPHRTPPLSCACPVCTIRHRS